MSESKIGSCLCGGVTYILSGPVREVIACHCTQCRKQSGHYFAASRAKATQFEINDEQGLIKWYRSSDDAARGFCSNCGSALFWKFEGSEYMSVLAGSIDGKTNLKIGRHIFTADKGDYYSIGDDETQFLENDS